MAPGAAAHVDALAARFLQRGGPTPVEATDVYTFAQSPYSLWCTHHAPREEKQELDRFRELLFEQGREHEKNILAKRFPHVVPTTYETQEEGFRSVLEAMASGARAIHGAPLLSRPDGLQGRADVLQRVDTAASVFGAFHYEVREIKLAKNLAAHHRLQAAFYNHILGKVQGFTPATFALVNRENEETAFAYDEVEILAAIHAARAIREGRVKPPAIHGAGLWPWEKYADKCAREAGDVSIIAGVGPATREKLVAAGFANAEAIAAAEPSALTSVKGVGEKRARTFGTNARALLSGKHIQLGSVAFPEKRTELFFDLEGTGAQDTDTGLVEMDYLIGVLVRREGREEYRSFIAHSLEDEGRMFREFVDWLSGQEDYTLYHWHHYELTHLRKLVERHGIHPDMRAKLFGSLRDLFKDATGAFAFPTYDQSIKSIAPYMGFNWRHKDVNAMESIALYFDYARDPSGNVTALRKILDYNEDDCIAMRVAKDWLVENGSGPPP